MAFSHPPSGLPGDGEVISGMRQECTVFIYVDVAKAMADGIPFFVSENGVVLCEGEGERGFLSTKYFKKVVKR